MLTAAMLCAPAFAQAPAEWAAVAKTTNGPCPEGSTAFASERPGALHVRLVFPNGKQYAEFDVPLASDGSGKAEFKGFSDNATRMEVPAGRGKRAFKTAQASDICQWTWTPK
jgi:hypothetical protein